MSKSIPAFVAVATKHPDAGKTAISVSLAEAFAARGEITCLLDLDSDNASGTGTAYRLLTSRVGDRGYCVANRSTAIGADTADVIIVDTSRNPAVDVIDALKTDCSIVFIPTTISPKMLAEASALYRELDRSGVRAVIVPNLVDGGSYETIAGHFAALDPVISPAAIPHVPAVADLIGQGLPLAWCRTADKSAVDEFTAAIGALADLAVAEIADQRNTAKPVRAVK